MQQQIPHFILFSRSYCHLCDDMRQALQAQFAPELYSLEVRDVDQDEAALALYDELVPVLVGRLADGSEKKLCHYFLDAAQVQAFLLECA